LTHIARKILLLELNLRSSTSNIAENSYLPSAIPHDMDVSDGLDDYVVVPVPPGKEACPPLDNMRKSRERLADGKSRPRYQNCYAQADSGA
jgi:hypothetical protein